MGFVKAVLRVLIYLVFVMAVLFLVTSFFTVISYNESRNAWRSVFESAIGARSSGESRVERFD